MACMGQGLPSSSDMSRTSFIVSGTFILCFSVTVCKKSSVIIHLHGLFSVPVHGSKLKCRGHSVIKIKSKKVLCTSSEKESLLFQNPARFSPLIIISHYCHVDWEARYVCRDRVSPWWSGSLLSQPWECPLLRCNPAAWQWTELCFHSAHKWKTITHPIKTKLHTVQDRSGTSLHHTVTGVEADCLETDLSWREASAWRLKASPQHAVILMCHHYYSNSSFMWICTVDASHFFGSLWSFQFP